MTSSPPRSLTHDPPQGRSILREAKAGVFFISYTIFELIIADEQSTDQSYTQKDTETTSRICLYKTTQIGAEPLAYSRQFK